MIQHMLDIGVNLEVKDDIDYKLVQIKQAKVDHNLHTTVKLVDFLSVILQNKRIQFEDDDVTIK